MIIIKSKNMPTPDEYNKEYFKELAEKQERARYTGVKCPNCGEQMLYSDSVLLTSNPPQRNIHCPKCLHYTTIFV